MDWSKVRDGRARAYQLMPPLQSAPLIAGGESLIRRYVRADDWVLDVGGTESTYREILRGTWSSGARP